MDFGEWLDFLAPDDIRIKNTRIGIETVLYDHIHRGGTAEEIAADYDSLDIAQVYAVLLYYHTHREAMRRYLQDFLESAAAGRAKQAEDSHYDALRERLTQVRKSTSGDAA